MGENTGAYHLYEIVSSHIVGDQLYEVAQDYHGQCHPGYYSG